MVDSRPRQNVKAPLKTTLQPASKPTFRQNLLARFMAIALWKTAMALFLFVSGVGAVLVVNMQPQASGPALPPKKATPNAGVVLKKLVVHPEINAAQADYRFDFPYVVHKSFLFLTGETINIRGTASESAYVDLSRLVKSDIRRIGHWAVMVTVPTPQLGTPAISYSHTTLREKSGFFTHLTNLFRNDPDDAKLALMAAQNKVKNTAIRNHIIGTAEVSTEKFLTEVLKKLGFRLIDIVFAQSA